MKAFDELRKFLHPFRRLHRVIGANVEVILDGIGAARETL